MAGNIGDGSGADESSCQAGVRARRQWSIHGGDQERGSLRRLRASLADEGCWQSQLVVARQLLDSLPDGADAAEREATACRAVCYLVRASEQGSAEATELLAQCAASGVGVSEHNYIDVRECLDTPLEEKRTRHAARELFHRLAAGQQFVTTEQIRERLRRAGTTSSRTDTSALFQEDGEGEGRRERVASFFRRVDGEKLSEEALVSAACDLARGDVPAISRLLCDSAEWPVVPVLPAAPLPLSAWLETRMRAAGGAFEWLLCCVPGIVLLLLAWGWRTPESAGQFFAVGTLYTALLVMAAASLRLSPLLGPDSQHVLTWSRALQLADSSLDPVVYVRRFRRKHVWPQCWRLAGAALVVAVVRAHVPAQFSADSAVSALSLLLASVCLLACVAGSGPVPMSRGEVWRRVCGWFPLLASVAGVLVGPAAVPWCSRHVWSRVSVVFSSQGLLHALQLTGWVVLAVWRSAGLLPRLLPALWLQVSTAFLPGTATDSVTRWFLLWCVVSACLPALGSWPSSCTLYWLLSAVACFCCWWLSEWSVGVAVVAVLVSTAQSSRWRCLLVLLLLIQWSQYLAQISPKSNFSVDAPSLTWSSFQTACHGSVAPGSSGGSTSVHVERQCADLAGAVVLWRASVADVRVTSQRNWAREHLQLLPAAIRGPLACWLHEWRPPSETESECQHSDLSSCRRPLSADSPCSLRGWNIYSYSLHVEMPGAVGLLGGAARVELALPEGVRWERLALSMSVGDEVEFEGRLSSRLASSFPLVLLDQLQCIQCSSPDITAEAPPEAGSQREEPLQWWGQRFRQSCYSLISFIGSPLIQCEEEPFSHP